MTPTEYRLQRREIVRRHHPDAGGHPDQLQRLLEELDARRAAGTSVAVAASRSRRRRIPDAQTLAAAIDRLNRQVRSRLPRRLPGSRRYARIT